MYRVECNSLVVLVVVALLACVLVSPVVFLSGVLTYL